jgi:2'-5' RNA ligase
VRLFVAVSPPAPVIDALRRLERPDVAKLRWTTPDQWHVTLRFLGEVDAPAEVAAALSGVPEALRAVGGGEIRAELGPATAWFPGRQVLQVPVAGLDGPADAVARATTPWDGPSRTPPFRGHLTVARMRGAARGPARLAGTPIAVAWHVGEIVLVSSTLGAGGSRYRVEATVTLS